MLLLCKRIKIIELPFGSLLPVFGIISNKYGFVCSILCDLKRWCFLVWPRNVAYNTGTVVFYFILNWNHGGAYCITVAVCHTTKTPYSAIRTHNQNAVPIVFFLCFCLVHCWLPSLHRSVHITQGSYKNVEVDVDATYTTARNYKQNRYEPSCPLKCIDMEQGRKNERETGVWIHI